MGKDTNFTGQPLYVQLLNLTDRQKIRKISSKGGYDRYVKKLDGYTHFVSMLYAVLMRYDSLRETVIGMMAEAHKLSHLGIDYLIKRSTLSEANNRRSSEFFAKIYWTLYEQYRTFLADSTSEAWLKALHIMDSTTITLFSNILKGAGRNPKHGKKKGGIKAHTVIKADENVPCLVCYTSAATHDHFLLKELNLHSGDILAIDRAYIDYEQFEKMTQEGVFYVTKMKKNLVYDTLSSTYFVSKDGLLAMKESIVEFHKDDVTHRARMVEYWEKGKDHSVRLLTNHFDFDKETIIDIYDRRWQIETLFKQLKQNFPLRYFYGESVNAIESQIWVTLIANLLLSVVRKMVKRKWSFSNMVTMVRQMLMYYVDMFRFLENPERTWVEINAKRLQLAPPGPTLFD